MTSHEMSQLKALYITKEIGIQSFNARTGWMHFLNETTSVQGSKQVMHKGFH